jgi:hypothetical protein
LGRAGSNLRLNWMRALFAMIACLGVLGLGGCGKSAFVSEREAAVEALARHVAMEAKPSAVLVFSNPLVQAKGRSAENYELDQAGLRGLRRGFGEKIRLQQVFPALRPEAVQNPASVSVDPNSTTPLSFFVAEDAFQKAVEENPACTVAVSLIGLPVNLRAFPAWSKPGAPRFALLMPDWRMIGGRAEVLAAFNSGKLVAAIVQDPAGAAGSQFQLVTRSNVGELIQAKPHLFGY